ncbi:TonB-dependent siderophore receptor [Azospirillum rugosum]|uniref:Iron complex outermembrane receptor protein n=1 Tax=Azospirillum rugosum TaxID=416170 RepID=A0ABS4SUH4_9PROT|nr:TonB-dependent siderophore receptor [Azospirillum rugosum]MBP2296218.1 iron complex outermembrane receptor protein [Azospirillum rugosum]MDQ0527097.1 iron complex outermembrane receptor protein [Azospirillum rugosum]
MAKRAGKSGRRWGKAVGAAVLSGLMAPGVAGAQGTGTRAPAGTVEMPAVTVTGQGETALSPVTGYVANQQATGTKTDTPLIETPQSITVIPSDQIRDQNAQTLNQVVRYTAGVTPETRGAVATRYDQLKVRGFDADTYWNGLKLQSLWYAAPQLDPYLMERIEVLKGPSSVLYGQAPAGGLINQVSKRPTATRQNEIGFEFGTNSHLRGTADFSGPIDAEGKYLYRFTGVGLSEDGQMKMTENERVAIAPSFTWRPDTDTSLTLLGLYQRDPKANSYGGIPPQGTVLYNPLGKIPVDFYDGDPNFETFDRKVASVGYAFDKRLSDVWTARLNGRWMHTKLAYNSVYANGLSPDFRTLNRGVATSREEMDSYTLDNQVEGRFGTGPVQHTLLAGFDYQRVDGNYAPGFGVGPSLDIFAPVYGLPITPPPTSRTDLTSNQYGLYLQDQLRWNGFILTLAGRYDWTDTASTTGFGKSSKDDQAFTKRAGLTYVFENGIAPYVSYAESFTPQSGADITGKLFDPEEGTQYEVGVKYQPPGLNSLFTLALFDLTRSNLLTGDPANPGFSVQSGEARSRGVEFEARVGLTKQLDLIGTYSYQNVEFTKNNDGFQGKELPAVPRHQASAWAMYRMPEGTALNGLNVGAGVRFTGSTKNDANTFKVPSFTLVDAAVSYDLGALSTKLTGAEVSLNVKNLFDKEYVASCYYGDWCAYGYQRTVTAGLRYRW